MGGAAACDGLWTSAIVLANASRSFSAWAALSGSLRYAILISSLFNR